jgi:hypothetical protein
MLELEPAMTYRVTTRGPLGSTEGSPRGTRQYHELSEGTLTGPGLCASIAMPGGDWYASGVDGLGRPDVRVPLRTDDGELILLHYTGVVEATDAFLHAVEADAQTDWGDQYMRIVMTFDTGAERYRWLNRSLFVARGRLLGRSMIEYEIYRVA